jgi:hypothetical protein
VGTPGVTQENAKPIYALIAYDQYGNEMGLYGMGVARGTGFVALQSANMACLTSMRAMAPRG